MFHKNAKQPSASKYKTITPCFFNQAIGNSTCYINELGLTLTVNIISGQPIGLSIRQLMRAEVDGKYIGSSEMYGNDIKVRINNDTNSFDILVNGATVMQSGISYSISNKLSC